MAAVKTSSNTTVISDTTDREILFTRIFDAPREMVFEAWTNPRHLTNWWGPRGFSTTIHEMDVRPGGVWRLVMRGPDGRDYDNRLVFVEVVKPERLVYKHEAEPGSEYATYETTVTFAAAGNRTNLTMRMLFSSAEERERIVSTYKAIEGGNQTLDRLKDYLAGKTPTELELTRIFDAPRELVFKAWTDSARLKQWWGPRNFTNPVCEIDVRPGGAIRIDMRAPDGVVYPMTGVFQEVVEPERIVFLSGALNKNGEPMFDVSNRITFTEEGGKTRLTLRATVSNITPEAAPHLAGMNQGWNQSLDRLEAEVIEKAAVLTITRVFDAPKGLVWKAFTEAERLKHWWGPKGFTMLVCEVDLRPGGVFLYSMKAPDGNVMWGKWVYRTIVAAERMVTVVSFCDEKGNILRHPMSATWPLEVLNAMTLAEREGKTTMTLYAIPVNATAEECATFAGGQDSMKKGYAATLDQLDAYLAHLAHLGQTPRVENQS